MCCKNLVEILSIGIFRIVATEESELDQRPPHGLTVWGTPLKCGGGGGGKASHDMNGCVCA
jgi:hypothetical protein